MSAGAAVSSAKRSRGRHAASCRPPGSTEQSPNKSNAQPVVVECLIIPKEKLLLEGADLSDFFHDFRR